MNHIKLGGWGAGALVWLFGYAPLCSALTFTPLSRDYAMEAARAVTLESHPNAEVVQVDSRHFVVYEKDGTYSEWYESYVKILTEKGRRRYKSVTSSFTIPYNTTEFQLVEVIRADGSVENVDIARNSSEMVEQSQMDANIYDPNNRILRVTIPEVEVGDTVHFIVYDRFDKVRMPDVFSDYVLLEGIDPIVRSEYTVAAPRDMPLRSMELKSEIPGTVTATTEYSGEKILYTWTASNVPRAFEEPQMPKLYTQMQRLLISTIPDWETVSRWYWNLCRPHIEDITPEMEQTVKGLISGIKDPQAKVWEIFQWVSQEVRYLGITVEKDAPGYEPHPVRMTFERRAGICRDKAALLVAMLRIAGFEAYPVLIMNGPKKDPEVPQPLFNHAVSCIRLEDGTYILMDATDENTPVLFPAYLNNQSYLVASPTGETLLTSPVIPAEQNMMRIDTTGTLDDRGTLKAQTVLRFDGFNDNAYRTFFSRLSCEEREQYIEKIVMRTAPGGILTSCEILPVDMLDTSKPIEVRASFEVKNWAITGDDAVMLPMIRFGRSVGMANILVGKMGLKQRKYPYVTEVACGIRESLRLELGESVGELVSLPDFTNVENEGSSWSTHVSVKDRVLAVDNVFKMKVPEFSPKEYLELQETLKIIEADSRKMPIFRPVPPLDPQVRKLWYSSAQECRPDAIIIDESHEYDVKDEHSWTETRRVRMKVLTYAGVKNYSDLRIRYNPATEKVEVKNAVVTSSSGTETSIDKDEINIMDADWVADAPRYPASRVMVVSLPGVEIGSVIDYTIVRTKTGQPFFSLHGESSLIDSLRIDRGVREHRTIVGLDGVFRYHEPIEKKTVRVRVPEGMKLKTMPSRDSRRLYAWSDLPGEDIAFETFSEGGSRVYEFSASKVPPVFEEDFLPPWYAFNPVAFASSGDWKEYAREVEKRLLKAVSSKDRARRIAKALVKNAQTDMDRIRVIRDYVDRAVKNINTFWHEIPLDCITPADRVLSDGYGNSADRAVVIHAMLSEAGFKPEFVLASWVSPIEELKKPLYEYPAPHWFKGVLVRVRSEGGYIYLNDTDQYAIVGTTGSAGHPCLVLRSGAFETIEPLSDRHADRRDTDISIRLSEDGDIVLTQKRTFYGENYAAFRKQFSEMPPEERKRHHEQLISSISQAAKPLGDYVTRYDQYPGTEELSVQIDSYAVRQDGYLYLKVPGLINILEGVTSDKRENPLYQSGPRNARISVDVLLPDGIKACELLPPDGFRVWMGSGGGISMETSVTEAGNGRKYDVVRIVQDVDIDPVIVPPSRYPDLLDSQRVISHPSSNLILMRMR
ncbi:MAG TPA: DUF3857 domain-containing protein [Deltaproteobacteria bacterium]|nr:DUF3857 domain-containing protein [Deltaproteobacteria bacterium]